MSVINFYFCLCYGLFLAISSKKYFHSNCFLKSRTTSVNPSRYENKERTPDVVMLIKCLLQVIATLCLSKEFFLVSFHFSFKLLSSFDHNSLLIMWTFFGLHSFVFLGGYSFFSKKVFFVFYWIVNLASLFLLWFYNILL